LGKPGQTLTREFRVLLCDRLRAVLYPTSANALICSLRTVNCSTRSVRTS
jgi:hypothetical protein